VKAEGTIRTARDETGIALLISIFVLLLISVVAIALIVSSGTESALAGNYRSSTGVYYAAIAGIEEARGRMLTNVPYSFKTTWPAFYPAPGATLPIGTVGYVLNPGPTETAGNMLPAYPDTEYNSEFGTGPLTVKTTLSVWNKPPLTTNLPFPGPLYKWVRINAVSEQTLNLDTSPYDGRLDPAPLYYDGTNLNDANSGNQVFEITALAVLPNSSGQSSQKIVQYLVAPSQIPLPPLLAALTLSGSPGNSPVFQAPLNNAFYAIKGNDYDCSGNPAGSPKVAIGLFGDYSGNSFSGDLSSIKSGIPTNASGTNTQPNYTGLGPAPPTPNPPDVEYLTAFPANLQSPIQIDAVAQNIIQNAAAVTVPVGSAGTQQAFLNSLGMSPTNIITVIANGDLDLTNWNGTGYGLLLVTGTLTFDPGDTWNGIVLVIGNGIINNIDHGRYEQINGAVFVAKTRNAGVLLPGRIGGASVSFDPPMQGYGIRYSSCWIQKAQPFTGYKILSYHEIAQ
jgi:hypothetical protein